MSIYRVVGVIQIDFVHEVEADSAEEADRLVENLRLDEIDNYCSAEPSIHTTLELDEDGEEIEDEEDEDEEEN